MLKVQSRKIMRGYVSRSSLNDAYEALWFPVDGQTIDLQSHI